MSERLERIDLIEKDHSIPSMGEQETLTFLTVRGVEPLQEWQPGKPVLYVLHAAVREGFGAYMNLPESERPSIARVDSPTFLTLEDAEPDNPEAMVTLGNDGGQIDYFAIDPTTNVPRLVKTSNSVRGRDVPYAVQKNLLFEVDDSLFPRSVPQPKT